MHLLITGGTGFIGRELCRNLLEQGHTLTLLTRQSLNNTQAVKYRQNLAELTDLDEFDAVINLVGEPIFDRRWTPAQKQKLIDSRLIITRQLAHLFQQSRTPPHTFISGSASGFYGSLPPAKKYDEQTACGQGFAAELCQQWESAALDAAPYTRVCLLRTGMVMDPSGGALQRMLPLYRLGLAGKLGDGKQHWAWISRHDHIQATLFLLTHPHCHGAYNLVAPNSLPNAQFTRLLAQKLHRPAFFSAPALALKWILGERAQILLDNQPLVPQKLLEAGFTFRDQTFNDFLQGCGWC